jgi:uncharacterized lipoprotein
VARKPTDYVQFKLRIRESLRRKIERAAEKKKHSANAEAVELIERAFDEELLWAERAYEMAERKSEIQQMERDWFLAEATREAEANANARDAQLFHRLAGSDDGSRLIIRILMKLGADPNWSKSVSSRQKLADEILPLILDVETTEGDIP